MSPDAFLHLGQLLLVTANLTHGGTANAVCEALLDQRTWLTAFVDEDRETAISVKL